MLLRIYAHPLEGVEEDDVGMTIVVHEGFAHFPTYNVAANDYSIGMRGVTKVDIV